MDDVILSQSPTVIIVGTAAATGLIILLILNTFVCGCIVAMCLRNRRARRQPTFERCTPTVTPSTVAVPLVRIQFDEETDYSEIAPRPDDAHRIAEMRAQHVAMSQQHLATRQWEIQNSSYFTMSQPQLNHTNWESQRMVESFDNIYSSVIDSQEELTEEPEQVRAIDLPCMHTNC